MKSFPTGIVTFLFTDIKGSTSLAQKYPDLLPKALKIHNQILKTSIESNNGFIFQIVGDAFCAAFQKPEEAIAASLDAQIKLNNENWGKFSLKVRMGMHTGPAEYSNNNYLGYVTLAQTQRVMSAAYGGQILTTENTSANFNQNISYNIAFKDLGERKLKDLIHPVRIFQIVSDSIQSDFPPIKTIDARPNNLPYQSTTFIGREKEISEIISKIRESRLLTLTGPGGTGKTRLCIQSAENLIDEFENGIWFVELAAINGKDLIIDEISSAMNFKPEETGDKLGQLINYLRNKKMIILLDNCEHIVNDCAFVTEKILMNCPNVKILASSRQVMNIKGEKHYKVPALMLPETDITHDTESAGKFESVKLFEDRARHSNPEFSITDLNADAVVKICQKLDGIPLAIELAAARLKVTDVNSILDRLNDRFRLLKTGSRTALPRQKTLRAMIDWSYDLLDEKEKLLFQRLTVFSKGWSMESAEEICSDENISKEDVIDLISDLADKSLVLVNYHEQNVRYSMLETILEYGKEKLEASGTMDTFSNKHFNYYLNFCKVKNVTTGRNQINMFKSVISDFDNLRAAINRIMMTDPSLALELANEIGDIWELNGKISEGYETFEKIFSIYNGRNQKLKAQGYLHLSFLCSQTGKYDEAEKYLTASLEIFRKLDDSRSLGDCINNLGNLYFLKEEMDKSENAHNEALKIGLDSNDKFLIGMSCVNIASINSYYGKFNEAIEKYEEGLKIFRELNDIVSSSRILIQLGREEMKRGNQEKARNYYDESIPVLKELDDHIPLIVSLLNLSMVSTNNSGNNESLSLIEEALSLSKKFGYTSLLIHSYNKLGDYYLSQNLPDIAAEAYINALKSDESSGSSLKTATHLVKIISSLIMKNENHKSLIVFGAVLRIHKTLESDFKESISSKLMSDLDRVKNDSGIENSNLLIKQGEEMNLPDVINLLSQ
ncbi:MAG: hypothetical protein HGGPFJEG_00584 [Ignavibacteria bacterium]|nr:hypothetical protein [Ignavibacteria bacterium]